MGSFYFIAYPGQYAADDKNGEIELNIKDSIAFLKATFNKYNSHPYYYSDTLKPYFGSTCTKFSDLYGCPCKGLFFGGQCDCQDCLDSARSIFLFRGNLSQIYLSPHGYFVCDLEDTVGATVFWHRTFNIKIPEDKFRKIRK